MKRMILSIWVALLSLTACQKTSIENSSIENVSADNTAIEHTLSENVSTENPYQQITQEAAKKMMDEQEVLILDVREQDEYDSGHIVDAVLLPVGNINEDTAAEVIEAKDSVVLVYCRSGNRSKKAAEALAELGYTQVYEFGGINTWTYETE